MSTSQTISIVVAVIVTALVVSASIVINMPKQIVEHKSTDQQTIDNGQEKTTQEIKKYTLRDIINYVTQKQNA